MGGLMGRRPFHRDQAQTVWAVFHVDAVGKWTLVAQFSGEAKAKTYVAQHIARVCGLQHLRLPAWNETLIYERGTRRFEYALQAWTLDAEAA